MEGRVGLKESCWHTMQSVAALVSRRCESEISPPGVFEKELLINLGAMSLQYSWCLIQKIKQVVNTDSNRVCVSGMLLPRFLF